MDNNELNFIARHYRKGRFSTDAGWRRLGIARAPFRRRYRVAAAIASMVVLAAAAGLIYRGYATDDRAVQTEEVRAASPLKAVKVIDFENASLETVVAKIETVYGVKVTNLPEAKEKYSLSLHYEGTPTDLIATINDILGTRMEVVEK